jgi:hypothetical protein
MRIAVLVVLPVVVVTVFIIRFLNTGYPYVSPTPIAENTYVDTHSSQECIAKQNTADNLTAPLKEKADGLAKILISAPLPLNNGQVLLNQYKVLQGKIKQINSQYSC